MRIWARFAALLVLSVTIAPAGANAATNKLPDEETIAALEAKANHAEPRDQCFLYAEVVHQMTELSLHQYAAGDVIKADGWLKRIQTMASQIHLSLSRNDKRLKKAQILLSNTAFRLNELLHSSDYQDRSLVEQTLAKVNSAQDEAMFQVFQK